MKRIFAIGLAGLLLAGCGMFQREAATATKKPVRGGKEIKIGLILPLSGQYATYGKYSLHGAECAAGQKEPCAAVGNITLVSKDTAGDTAKAVAAVQELATKDQVSAIVGPLMSNDALPVAEAAQRARVPLVSLSQRDGVAEVGDYTFRIAMNAQSQVGTLAQYAVKDRGWQRIAILYPNSKLGEQYRDLFRAAVTNAGGQISTERSYAPGLSEQLETYLRPKTAVADGGEVVVGDDPNATASAILPAFSGVKGADAVFIPDSYQAVVGMLKAYGPKVFGGATLLGTNRWNSPGLLAAGKGIEGAVFVDGFFKQSSDPDTSRFASTFLQAFGVDPTILEAQAYDAVSMVALAAGRNGGDAARVQAGLARMKKFHGVSGSARFTSEGDAQKELFILTVSGGDIQEAGRRSLQAANVRRTGDPAALTRAARPDQSLKYDIAGEAVVAPPVDAASTKYETVE